MNKKRKQRVYIVLSLVVGITAAVGLSLYALGQNINLYYTPTQLLAQNVVHAREIRLGGLVVKNSVKQVSDSLVVNFTVTDLHHFVRVYYQGILPALFREGQGIVAQGRLNANGVFIADQVLAKHDANYKPPGIK